MRAIGRMTTVAAACVMALGLAACSGSTAPAADAPASEAPATEAPATEEGGTIYLVSKGFQPSTSRTKATFSSRPAS